MFFETIFYQHILQKKKKKETELETIPCKWQKTFQLIQVIA